jgi:hypothetical protein
MDWPTIFSSAAAAGHVAAVNRPEWPAAACDPAPEHAARAALATRMAARRICPVAGTRER